MEMYLNNETATVIDTIIDTVIDTTMEEIEEEYNYYDVDDDGFDHYIIKTVDPGPWLFIGVCIYSTCCMILLPFLVSCHHKYNGNGNKMKKDAVEVEMVETTFEESFESEGSGDNDLELVVECRGTSPSSSPKSTPSPSPSPSPVQCKDRNDPKQTEIGCQFECEKSQEQLSGNSDYSPIGKLKAGTNSNSKSNSAPPSPSPPTDAISSPHLSPIAKIIPRMKQMKRSGSKNDSYSPLIWDEDEDEDDADVELGEGGKGNICKITTETDVDSTKDTYHHHHCGGTTAKNLFPEKLSSVRDNPTIQKWQGEDGCYLNWKRNIRNALSSSTCCAKANIKIFDDNNNCGRSEVLETLTGHVNVNMNEIIKPDEETRQLFKLGIPFTCSAISDSFFEALTLLLISRYLHVHAVSAYVVSNLLMGITSSLIWGFLSTLETLCSHAMGASNPILAGHYVQIAMVLFSIASIPFLGIWWFYMEVCLEWFGLSEVAVEIGTQYAKVTIFSTLVSGLYEGFELLPDISGHEVATTLYGLITSVIDIFLLWTLLENVEGFDLYWIGVMHLVEYVVVFAIFGVVSVWLGWFEPYWDGMVKTSAFKNKEAVLNVVKTAIPLSLGSLLEYGEWQILTIFVAALGPAEVAAWGIMEAIWELFEAAVGGFSEAGSVRLALHLGEGNIRAAQKAAWKSLFVTTCLASFVTVLFFVCGGQVAIWFTEDATLQLMIEQMIPLVGFSNVFMAFGTMSWALVGAQGRYMHSTIISAIVSFFITIPISAFSCVVMHYELKGLVGALLVGYSTTTLCTAYLLFTSDWHTISKNIIASNEEEDDDESSSDESSFSDNDDDDLSDTLSVASLSIQKKDTYETIPSSLSDEETLAFTTHSEEESLCRVKKVIA